jgi:hypothetical protein
MAARSTVKCYLSSGENGKKVLVGVYHNVYTNQGIEAELRTLLQTTSGTKITSGHYPKKLAYCTGSFPSDPLTDDIGTVQSYEDFSALSDVSSTSNAVSGTRSAEWTNSTGEPVTVTYLATTFGSSVTASQVFNMVNIEDTSVGDTQSFTVNWEWEYEFQTDDSSWAPATL